MCLPGRESGGAAGLPPSSPLLQMPDCRRNSYTGILVAVRQLQLGGASAAAPAGGASAAAPARGASAAAPARGASAADRQLRRGSTIPFSSVLRFNTDFRRVKAKVPFPQFFSTTAEKTPTTSLYLLSKYQRRQTQSLWFIITPEGHIAFGRDIRYYII